MNAIKTPSKTCGFGCGMCFCSHLYWGSNFLEMKTAKNARATTPKADAKSFRESPWGLSPGGVKSHITSK
jgi:hypothetical protein